MSSCLDRAVYLKHPPDSSSRIEAKLCIVIIDHNVSIIANTQLEVERDVQQCDKKPDNTLMIPAVTMDMGVAMEVSGVYT